MRCAVILATPEPAALLPADLRVGVAQVQRLQRAGARRSPRGRSAGTASVPRSAASGWPRPSTRPRRRGSVAELAAVAHRPVADHQALLARDSSSADSSSGRPTRSSPSRCTPPGAGRYSAQNTSPRRASRVRDQRRATWRAWNASTSRPDSPTIGSDAGHGEGLGGGDARPAARCTGPGRARRPRPVTSPTSGRPGAGRSRWPGRRTRRGARHAEPGAGHDAVVGRPARPRSGPSRSRWPAAARQRPRAVGGVVDDQTGQVVVQVGQRASQDPPRDQPHEAARGGQVLGVGQDAARRRGGPRAARPRPRRPTRGRSRRRGRGPRRRGRARPGPVQAVDVDVDHRRPALRRT